MASLSGLAAKLQEQIATGKRIQTPSDDPLISARIARMNLTAADQAQFQSNITLAQSLLATSDTTLESMGTQLQRAQELMIRAGSDTLNDENRGAIGAELKAILDDLYSLANTTDVRGTALFGGSAAGPAYARAADGRISFVGSGEAPPIPTGEGVSVQATDNGDRLFGGIQVGGTAKDIFKIVGDLADALSLAGPANEPARKQALAEAAEGLAKASERVSTGRASVGARGARLDIEAERLAQAGIDNKIERGSLEGVDIQAAVTDLQQTMLALQATQASFSKLSQLTLFDYIR
jgi:flagellar hook-associated protein 3 FlgL